MKCRPLVDPQRADFAYELCALLPLSVNVQMNVSRQQFDGREQIGNRFDWIQSTDEHHTPPQFFARRRGAVAAPTLRVIRQINSIGDYFNPSMWHATPSLR